VILVLFTAIRLDKSTYEIYSDFAAPFISKDEDMVSSLALWK